MSRGLGDVYKRQQQNLLVDDSRIPVEHPDVPVFFGGFDGESYEILENSKN